MTIKNSAQHDSLKLKLILSIKKYEELVQKKKITKVKFIDLTISQASYRYLTDIRALYCAQLKTQLISER